MSAPSGDWQTLCRSMKDRGEYLLESGLWTDCKFIVGIEPHQQVLECHKLFLAMASPVFQAMFFGGMPEKSPITILDVQPEPFKALLEYIYTDKINLTSFDQACELCYGAKKYMLPHLVEECMKYLWSDLQPKNACRAYEFAKLFEEPKLMEKCLLIIKNRTYDVLRDVSFEDVDIGTILTMLDQEQLSIHSELDIFNALARIGAKQSNIAGAKVPRLDGIGNVSATTSNESSTNCKPSIRDCLMKIRFLTLTPQQFAEGPAVSSLLTQSEKFAILMNISSPSTDISMPPGFSKSTTSRQNPLYMQLRINQCMQYRERSNEESAEVSRKAYCMRESLRQTEFMNVSVLDCSVTFKCDRNVCVYGIQVPTQLWMNADQQPGSYSELLYAHLLDADGSRLTYTHFTSRVPYYDYIDLSFNRPVFIQKNKSYRVGVVLNKSGLYPMCVYPTTVISEGVKFTFGSNDAEESDREGYVRAIIFSLNSTNNVNNSSSNDTIVMC